ncbi:MAG: [glutamine synthetase] adenylyltransferase / [glutamine synthetase]-adenylyl-L-tyrosine, partial [Actinomycetota bacterium]|nr:[glutamine synthetase] adenylyltransferase / [glutamine synthetase]-adenylyl-L-tyrosine [Actinomycetota bacterium]
MDPELSTSERRSDAVRVASRSLAAFIDEEPAAASVLEDDSPLPDGAGYEAVLGAAVDDDGMDGLRRSKRLMLLAIAARDLTGEVQLEQVGRALSDLADASLDVALQTIEATETVAVIGMGKLGGRELNYSSDIDLMFVSRGDEEGTKAAEQLVKDLGAFSPQGQAYRIDLNLRPEGRSGALVRSVEGYLEYYRRWAKEWEYQALLKARSAAGALELGDEVVAGTRDLVFPTEVSEARVNEIRKMKERVEENAVRTARRSKSTEWNDVKLGPGGIRDIEFSVQLLQLVHGSDDDTLRSGATLPALTALVEGGYIAEDDGAGLAVAYRWLRTVEHRLQLWQERQVHMLPTDEASLSRLARVMGFKDTPSAGAADRFVGAHRAVLADVRGRFEKLFYRPMIESLAEGTGTRLSPEALGERLRVLGFRDVERAARTLEGLVSGTSRRARVFRFLTPALLKWLAASPTPDEGLFSFLKLGEALHGRLDVLGSFRDNPPGLALLAKVLGSGKLLGEVLSHVPDELTTIADTGRTSQRKDRNQLVKEARASLEWRGDEGLMEGLRRFKRRELMHIAIGDVAGETDATDVGSGLADLAEAVLEAALDPSLPFAVIGMGKLGGRELSYSSDIDVMFVHDGDPGVVEKAAEDLIKAIGEITPEGQAFQIDLGLRPEGKQGTLARSLDSFAEYYARWAKPWEFQALTKARFAAGSTDVGERFLAAHRKLAFPDTLSSKALAEIRHLKARMEKERIPRGTDPRRHVKLGPGGMSDIEFAVQILQLQHGSAEPSLQVTATIDAIRAA